MPKRAQRHLHTIDLETGEAHVFEDDEPCPNPGCQELASKYRGALSQIGRLRNEVQQLHGAEPRANEIRDVLGYWREQVKPSAKIKPGSERWIHVRARLADGFSVDELKSVVDGAMLSEFHRQKPEYLDARSIFGSLEKVESHIDRLADHSARLPLLPSQIPTEVLYYPFLEQFCRRCDCGHIALFHSKPDPARNYFTPCLERDCGCVDFDDSITRAEEWLKERNL